MNCQPNNILFFLLQIEELIYRFGSGLKNLGAARVHCPTIILTTDDFVVLSHTIHSFLVRMFCLANKNKFLGNLILNGFCVVMQGEHIGIYSKNREEWMVADQACAAYSLVIVALYDTLGENAVAFITRHASIRFVICSRESFPQVCQSKL